MGITFEMEIDGDVIEFDHEYNVTRYLVYSSHFDDHIEIDYSYFEKRWPSRDELLLYKMMRHAAQVLLDRTCKQFEPPKEVE